jgi:hypothetical protein
VGCADGNFCTYSPRSRHRAPAKMGAHRPVDAAAYLGIGLGWLFATLAVAGYTGLVRNAGTE